MLEALEVLAVLIIGASIHIAIVTAIGYVIWRIFLSLTADITKVVVQATDQERRQDP